MTHVIRRLTAKKRDQLRNPTLGNRVWAAFTFISGMSQSGGSSDAAFRWQYCSNLFHCVVHCVLMWVFATDNLLGFSTLLTLFKAHKAMFWLLMALNCVENAAQMQHISLLILLKYACCKLQWVHSGWTELNCSLQPINFVNRERKCADTIGTVLVPCAGRFQC